MQGFNIAPVEHFRCGSTPELSRSEPQKCSVHAARRSGGILSLACKLNQNQHPHEQVGQPHGVAERNGCFSGYRFNRVLRSGFSFSFEKSSMAFVCHFTAASKSPDSAQAAARVSMIIRSFHSVSSQPLVANSTAISPPRSFAFGFVASDHAISAQPQASRLTQFF